MSSQVDNTSFARLYVLRYLSESPTLIPLCSEVMAGLQAVSASYYTCAVDHQPSMAQVS